jgi:NAD(P)-dependent dehydrogenase (short-subunit alcohol dehydrogenase family)
VHAATKAYVNSLPEALRAELRGYGVIVTALCPGSVDTEFQEAASRPGHKVKPEPGPEFLQVTVESAVAGKRRWACAGSVPDDGSDGSLPTVRHGLRRGLAQSKSCARLLISEEKRRYTFDVGIGACTTRIVGSYSVIVSRKRI